MNRQHTNTVPASRRHCHSSASASFYVWAAFLTLATIFFAFPHCGAQQPHFEEAEQEFRPQHVLPRQPAIIHPPILAGSQIADEVTESDLILGVVVNGKARAYPINMLNGPFREIINDSLGGQPIAAMWCHLCHSAIVFDRRLDDHVLTFQVSGMLWNRTLVMYDAETESLWSLLLEKGVRGPMKDRKLKTLPSELTTWKKWRTLHPDTTILNLPHRQDGFVREFYDEPKPFVFGFVADRPCHVTLETLEKVRILAIARRNRQYLVTLDDESYAIHLFNCVVDGQTLSFVTVESENESPFLLMDTQTNSTWDAYTGKAIDGPLTGKQLEQEIGTIAYSRNWLAFYPDSIEVPESGETKE